jgi:hypothetical protein
MALRIQDPDARHRFVEMARKWRALAKEFNELSSETSTEDTHE